MSAIEIIWFERRMPVASQESSYKVLKSHKKQKKSLVTKSTISAQRNYVHRYRGLREHKKTT